MRWLFLVGGLLVLVGFFFLQLSYAIGISGNSDERPFGYLILGVGVVVILLGVLMKYGRRR
jgi:hypothetical protein